MADTRASSIPFCRDMARGTLHDFYAASPVDAVTVNAFGLGIASQMAEGRPIVWGLDAMTVQEAGRPYAPGLNEMGFCPSDFLLVRTRDIRSLLAMGEEALRSSSVGAVVLSAWGEAKEMNLVASRRLCMAARSTGTTVLLIRTGARPAPSAAETRWSIGPAASSPLEAGAPGRPAFSVNLQRHRRGGAPRTWTLEWDRERRSFVEISHHAATLSRDLVSLLAQRPSGSKEAGPQNAQAFRRTA